ncbi:hypothetical protein [Aliikangiella coralliicola]|uniref:Uncharacterized protein n=1 Tax=Aliikangiella coralliicola TaxID=2592383 RepID=A0A545UA89_9GAMM|nr:hypothetical protein [Aliikangiella coralliicola]TQV86349.1 hypothetical protein FLL46_15610 [Aliikangiella coralliicola]
MAIGKWNPGIFSLVNLRANITNGYDSEVTKFRGSMSYPTIEDKILDDGRLSQWLCEQIVETREIDLEQAIDDVKKLKVILDKRLDRQIKERKTFKTQVNLRTIDF